MAGIGTAIGGVKEITVVGKVETLGEVAQVLEALKDQGITLESIQYVAERVYWEEIARKEQLLKEVRSMYLSNDS